MNILNKEHINCPLREWNCFRQGELDYELQKEVLAT